MNLTIEQKAAITTPKSLSVIASAGTGKTTVLTQRFLHCHLERETPLYNILAFTFTEKASREMKERVLGTRNKEPGTEPRGISYEQAPQLNISTIHSFCHRLLKQYGGQLGLKSDFEIYDPESLALWQESKMNSFVKYNIDEGEESFTRFLKYYGFQNLKETVRKLLQMDLSALKQSALNCINKPDEVDVESITAFIKTTQSFQKDLLNEKICNQLISYDDLEILCLQLLTSYPEILKELQQRYKHILVDEYQDVSPRQFELIKKLYDPDQNEIFIVGDPKQSIYGFRSADSRLFFTMTEMIVNHGGEKIYLTETFRTPKALQDYFNKIFPKVLPAKAFHKATTHKELPDAKVFTNTLPEKRENAPVRHTLFAEKITEMITNLIESGTQPEEIAILFYAKSPMDYYQQALAKNKIKVLTEPTLSFFDNPLIVTAWHILNYLAGQQDKITQVGLLRNPIFSFSESFIDHLIKSSSDSIFSEQTIDLFATHKDRETWTELYNKIQRWKTLSQSLFAAELFETIVNEMKPDQDLQEIQLVQKFSSMLRSWQKQDLYSLLNVKSLLKSSESMEMSQKSTDGHAEGVRLLTVHGAKGLEFEHVFVVPGTKKPNDRSLFMFQQEQGFLFKTHDCEFEKTLKYQLEETEAYTEQKEVQKKSDLEELARLIYVALTRAKKCLYLFPERPSLNTLKALEKNTTDTSIIKNFNEWIYWLTIFPGKEYTTSLWQPNLFQAQSPKDKQTHRHTDTQLANPLPLTPNHTLTVTELETFHHCQKRFELKYLNNIRPLRHSGPTTNHKAKTHLSPKERGTLFHEILQFYEYQRDDNLDTVIDQALFNQHLIDKDDIIRSECHLFINKLKQDLLFQKILFENLNSYEEVEFSCELRNFTLAGQIDKVVQIKDENGREKWMIIDYKTHHSFSEEERDRLAQEFSFQMASYALAITKRFRLSDIDTLILFTSGPSYRILHHSKEMLEDFETQINDLYDQFTEKLVQPEFLLTKDKNICRNCGYYRDDYCGIKSITHR